MEHQFSSLLTLGYIDGGTGSMLIQAALAGLFSAGYLIKTQWARLSTRFSTKSHSLDK